MAGHPDAAALVEAVRGFIAGLPLDGRDAFHAKVAANALAIVARELSQQPDAAEAAVLAAFLAGQPADANAAAPTALCALIRAGKLGVATPGLLDALIAAAVVRLRVDNPRYATLTRLERDAAVR